MGHPVAAFALGAVERLVGALEEFLDLVVGAGQRGEADRNRDVQRAPIGARH